jgi:hypothetical protein
MGGTWLTSHGAATEGHVEGPQCGSDDTKKEQDDAVGTSDKRCSPLAGDAQRNYGAMVGWYC